MLLPLSVTEIYRQWKCGDQVMKRIVTVEEASELIHRMRPRKVNVTISGNSLRFDVYLIDADDFDILTFDIFSLSVVPRNRVIEP